MDRASIGIGVRGAGGICDGRRKPDAAAVRKQAIGDPAFSNWTTVGVMWLAGFDFEIKVIARVPDAA